MRLTTALTIMPLKVLKILKDEEFSLHGQMLGTGCHGGKDSVLLLRKNGAAQ